MSLLGFQTRDEEFYLLADGREHQSYSMSIDDISIVENYDNLVTSSGVLSAR